MTLIADLADKGENPAEAPYDCVLEVDTENRQAVIVWTELLAFHAGQGDRWTPLVNSDGWLTAEALGRLQDRLEEFILRHVDSPTLKVWADAQGDDEPSVTFEVVTDYAEDETYEAWLDRIGWPIVATLINVTDPGTFMSPYLFDASGLKAK